MALHRLVDRQPEIVRAENILSSTATEANMRRAIAALLRGLRACRQVRLKGEMVSIADNTAQIRSAEVLLQFWVGKPVERQLIVSRSETSNGGFAELERLAGESEEFRGAVVKLLERLTAPKVPAIEVQSLPTE